jgi:hypothetical protein
MTLQHIVLFSFPQKLSVTDEVAMRAQVAAWPQEIGNILKLRFGCDLTGSRTNGYAYLLYMELADLDALHSYQSHPVHLRFRAWLDARGCTPLAFDYYLDAHTVFVS